MINIVTPALFKQPLEPSRNLLKKCGRLGDISVLYLLPLLVYIPIGLMIHMYWFVTFHDYAGYQNLSFYFGGIYLGSLLIYIIISTLYQWVKFNFLKKTPDFYEPKLLFQIFRGAKQTTNSLVTERGNLWIDKPTENTQDQ